MLRRFLRWLLSKLEPSKPPERIDRLEYYDEGGVARVGSIVGPVGLYLDLRPVGDVLLARLVSADEAVDSAIFWEQWKAWGGELFYEDGTPFNPTEL
jgi:hypothetical protein